MRMVTHSALPHQTHGRKALVRHGKQAEGENHAGKAPASGTEQGGEEFQAQKNRQ